MNSQSPDQKHQFVPSCVFGLIESKVIVVVQVHEILKTEPVSFTLFRNQGDFPGTNKMTIEPNINCFTI